MSEMTRREFVKTTGAAGLAIPMSASFLSARPHAAGSDTIRVGLIGCGGRGTGAAGQALRADKGAVLWAMGDTFPEHLESSLGRLTESASKMSSDGHSASRDDKIQCPTSRQYIGFDAYRKVIDSGVDVVILTTPPAFRPQHLRAAVESGKHVFAEKPVAVDATGIRSVIESAKMAKRNGTSLMSGFCWRYHSQVRETFDKIHSGGIGDVVAVQSTYNTTGWIQPKSRKPEWSDTEFQLRNWHYFTPISGDHIVEQAVHAIDWIAWAHKDVPPTKCTATGGRMTRPDLPETGNVYDNFAVHYEYEDGSRGYHMCRHWPNSSSDNTAYLMGTKGDCRMMPWSGTHVIKGKGQSNWRGSAAGNDMYQQEHDELFAAIRSGNRIDDGVKMANSSLMAIMGRIAAYTGKTVTWDDVMNAEDDLNPSEWSWGPRTTPTLAIPGSA